MDRKFLGMTMQDQLRGSSVIRWAATVAWTLIAAVEREERGRIQDVFGIRIIRSYCVVFVKKL